MKVTPVNKEAETIYEMYGVTASDIASQLDKFSDLNMSMPDMIDLVLDNLQTDNQRLCAIMTLGVLLYDEGLLG